MSIALTGTGGLYVRLGAEIAGANQSTTAVGSAANTRVTTINNQYLAAQQETIGGLYPARDSYRTANGSWLTYLQSLMQDTTFQMAIDDTTGINPQSFLEALQKVISQMKASFNYINKPTVSFSAAAHPSNHGNGLLKCSFIDGVDGLQTDYALAETITATCTADGFLGGGATAGQEPFQFIGQVSAGVYDWNWPQGSNCNTAVGTTDAAAEGGLLTDGDFEAWGGTGNNTPTDWTVAVGTTGTTILRGISPYTGTYNLQIVGNGSQLTTLRQTLTATSFLPSTVYCCNVMMKTDGSVAAGVIQFALVDGSNTVINDNAATANSFSVTVSGLTSSYASSSGFFRTPAVMPDSIQMQIALTTAITSTEVLNIDHLSVVPATQLYGNPGGGGGPYVAMFSGSTNWAINDSWQLVISNDMSNTTFVGSLSRWFGLTDLGEKIPSSSSPTISDGLIT